MSCRLRLDTNEHRCRCLGRNIFSAENESDIAIIDDEDGTKSTTCACSDPELFEMEVIKNDDEVFQSRLGCLNCCRIFTATVYYEENTN